MKHHSITKTRVRYAETDKMGVVYHSNYYLYMEIARTEYIRQRGMEYTDIENRGYMMFVTETSCKYFKPALFDQILTIEVVLEKLRGASFEYKYFIKNENGELLAEGRTSHAFADKSGKPTRIPEDIKEMLLKNI